MHETPATDVDAGMADPVAATGGKEHQIAALQIAAPDTGHTQVDHLAGRTRQANPGCMLIHIADQATAVETTFGGIAAVAVGRAFKANGTDHHIFGINAENGSD